VNVEVSVEELEILLLCRVVSSPSPLCGDAALRLGCRLSLPSVLRVSAPVRRWFIPFWMEMTTRRN
jgi:hypothetical protein